MAKLDLLAFNIKQAFEGEKFSRALSWLPDEEHSAILRYKFDKDKHLALASLLLRRHYFSKKLKIPWFDLEFGRLPAGKPYLINRNGQFDYNTSHEGDWVIFGCVGESNRNMQLGLDAVAIDLPRKGSIDAFIDCFQAQLTRHEMQLIKKNNLDEKARLETFYQLWGCKESYTKALGLGLSLELSKMEFTNEDAKVKMNFEGRRLEGWNFHISYLDSTTIAVICYGYEDVATSAEHKSKDEDINQFNQSTVLLGDTFLESSQPERQSIFTNVSFDDVAQNEWLAHTK